VVTVIRLTLPPQAVDSARVAVEKGDFDKAVEHYLQHLARKPQDWNVRLELAAVLATVDRPQALTEFRKIPKESEAFPDACRQIASICFDSQRFLEAEEALLALGDELAKDATAQWMLGELYFRQRRVSTALPYVQRSVELNPDQPRAQFLLAELLDDLGRPAEMIGPLSKVLSQQPEDYPTHLNLAYAYAEAGQPEASRREARWCVSRNPADVNARRFLALAARSLGEHEEALAEVQRALELSGEDVLCRLLEAELLLFDKQAELALQRLQSLLERHPKDRRLIALLVQAATAAGKADEAEQYRQQLQKLSER
jgi:tetratricopeptide (TPR) repeat protein